MKICAENILSFLPAKSQRTRIRLRVNAFGDSQSPKIGPTPHLTNLITYHLKEQKKKLSYFTRQLSSPIG